MKALLIVIVLEGASTVVPMPTMEGCWQAAEYITKYMAWKEWRKGTGFSLCVENK